MTEKRFKQIVDGVKDTRTGNTLTHPLEFTLKLNEINGLYDYVFDRNEELEKENEQLKQVLGGILIEVKQQISTSHTGEIRAFINPNSFDLISEVLRKYGALKEWYDD